MPDHWQICLEKLSDDTGVICRRPDGFPVSSVIVVIMNIVIIVYSVTAHRYLQIFVMSKRKLWFPAHQISWVIEYAKAR